ncbi:MAG: hypothetical protein O3C28_10770 [Proteobacteria bacterium]|nr:hypothetical protein [Pseudomonadota bacterium]
MPLSPAIWVFESKSNGDHRDGAAAMSLKRHGAVSGQGSGAAGNSYALATLDASNKPLPWADIKSEVSRFIDYLKAHPSRNFKVMPGSVRRSDEEHRQLADLMRNVPSNCELPGRMLEILGRLNIVRLILLDANVRAVDPDARKKALDEYFAANAGLWNAAQIEIISFGSAHTLVANDRYAKGRGYLHRIINVDSEAYGDDAEQVLEMLSIAYATKLVCLDDPDGTSTSARLNSIRLAACGGLEIDNILVR